MNRITSSAVCALAASRAFDRPLVANHFRGHLVEAMVALALEPEWKWVSQDWGGWDFENAAGTRLEVKQSAACQSWQAPAKGFCPPRFDIRSRTGHWEEGSVWVESPGRKADIYVFSYHPLTGEEADHRDPMQWRFYVVPASALPEQKTIGLTAIRALASDCGIGELAEAVA